VSKLSLQPAPPLVPFMTVVARGHQVWDLELLGQEQQALNLISDDVLGTCLEDHEDPFSDGPRPEATNAMVELVIRDDVTNQRPVMRIQGKILTYKPARVRFVLQPPDNLDAGIYEGQVGLFVGVEAPASLQETPGGGDSTAGPPRPRVIETWPVMLEVRPNLFEAQDTHGRITMHWVRMSLRDHGNDDESLIEGFEWADEEIYHAVRQAVDHYNATPPFAREIRSYTRDFPDRGKLLVGVQAFLYRMAAAKFRREFMPGESVDPNRKSGDYEQLAELRLQEFADWAVRFKAAKDSASYWGVI